MLHKIALLTLLVAASVGGSARAAIPAPGRYVDAAREAQATVTGSRRVRLVLEDEECGRIKFAAVRTDRRGGFLARRSLRCLVPAAGSRVRKRNLSVVGRVLRDGRLEIRMPDTTFTRRLTKGAPPVPSQVRSCATRGATIGRSDQLRLFAREYTQADDDSSSAEFVCRVDTGRRYLVARTFTFGGAQGTQVADFAFAAQKAALAVNQVDSVAAKYGSTSGLRSEILIVDTRRDLVRRIRLPGTATSQVALAQNGEVAWVARDRTDDSSRPPARVQASRDGRTITLDEGEFTPGSLRFEAGRLLWDKVGPATGASGGGTE